MTIRKKYTLAKKVVIGSEVDVVIRKAKYFYQAYREIGKKYELSENQVRECHNIFLAYNLGMIEQEHKSQSTGRSY
jgi:hypothetical protein